MTFLQATTIRNPLKEKEFWLGNGGGPGNDNEVTKKEREKTRLVP